MKRRIAVGMVCAGLLAACAPALDWREVHLEDSAGVLSLFPCKPQSQARRVRLGALQARLVLHACTAADTTWALAVADVGDPASVSPALAELRASAAQNLGAATSQPMNLDVHGATPNALNQRVQLNGKLPDGRAVTEQVAVFAKGTRVFQATALGEKLDAEAADTFFGGLRFSP